MALMLSKVYAPVILEFIFAPEFGFKRPGPKYQGLRLTNFIHDNFARVPVLDFDSSVIQELNEIYTLLKKFDGHKYEFISKALGDFLYSMDISEGSPFRFLSYFTIIEQLLTTSNSKREDYKSLRTQIITKVNLINNQLAKPIVPSKYLNVPNTDTLETVMDKLYAYRNDIAHGNRPDYEKNLSILKRNERQKVLAFIRVITQAVLIFSIKQPQLVSDLKAC